jgi:hypothetical protein
VVTAANEQDELGRTERLDAARIGVARVNLLPADVLIERRRRRVTAISAGLLVAYLGALGVIYALKIDAVDQARAERDQTERQVAMLQAEEDSLSEYQQLIDTLNNREMLLTSAMDGQLSWARILGDLALALDRDASLLTVVAASTAPGADAAAAPGAAGSTTGAAPPATAAAGTDGQAFDAGEPVAQLDFTGYSVEAFDPGVKEVLHKFGDAEGFFDSYLTTAAEEERGTAEVTTFVGRVRLNEGVYTHRYDDGLPEESVQ